ncbi:MAG: DUF3592 domain-containing protein [Gammaproteobacteria bacterium]|nr:DUF3592 domain-containing protein [Gammaproteobacteria bacterium]
MSQSETSYGQGFLKFFGLIFLVIGLVISGFGAVSVYQSLVAKQWTPVPATLHDIKLSTSRSKNAYTYKVEGQFSYQFNGKTYLSNQLDFESGKDNIGDYHKRFYKLLNDHNKQEKPITAFVNPENPAQAVINREIRWEMLGINAIFLLVFGGIGLGILILVHSGKKKQIEEQQLKKRFPTEPWRWKPEWKNNEFKSNSKSGFWAIAIFALFWNVISTPISLMIIPELYSDKDWKLLIVMIFPILGIALIAGTIIYYLRWRKFGDAKLTLKQTPLKIGGTNQGHILIPTDINNTKNILVTLTCQQITTKGSGKHRRTSVKTIWQDNQTASPHRAKEGSRLDFNFKIPSKLPQAQNGSSKNRIAWQLKAEKDMEGVDLSLEFDLPAFIR